MQNQILAEKGFKVIKIDTQGTAALESYTERLCLEQIMLA